MTRIGQPGTQKQRELFRDNVSRDDGGCRRVTDAVFSASEGVGK